MLDKKVLLQHIQNRQRTVEEQNQIAEASLGKTLSRAAQHIIGAILPGEGGIASTPAQQFDRIQRKRSRMSQDREERAASDEKSAEQERQAAIENVPDFGQDTVRVQVSKGRGDSPWSMEPPVDPMYKTIRGVEFAGQREKYIKAMGDRDDAIKASGERRRSAERAQGREREFRAGLEFKDEKNRPDL